MPAVNSPVITNYVIQPPSPPRLAPIYMNKGKGDGLTAVFTEYDALLAIWADELKVAEEKKKEDEGGGGGGGGGLMTPEEQRAANFDDKGPIGAWAISNEHREFGGSGINEFGSIVIFPMEFRQVPVGSIKPSSPGNWTPGSVWNAPTYLEPKPGYVYGPPRTILVRYLKMSVYPISVFLTPGYDVPLLRGGFIPGVETSCRLVTRRVSQSDLLCWLESADTPPVPLTDIHIGTVQVQALTTFHVIPT